jgi:hypothetical protein
MTMATQDQQNQQNQQGQQNQQRSENRSENLLPGDSAEDGRDGQFSVAEEVNLDQQGDMARRVGKAPKGIASDALADSLEDDKKDE